MENAYLNWSSGKDSALALYHARRSGRFHVAALFSVTTGEKIAMHQVGTGLLKKQAEAIGLPLTVRSFRPDWTAEAYGAAMERQMAKFRAQGITTALFGDLYWEELRNRRAANCARAGFRAEFPLWKLPGDRLMAEFVELGFRAVVTSIDCAALPEEFLGRIIDNEFIKDYPSGADLCGEGGEYHSFVFDGPIFRHPVDFQIRGRYYRDYAEAGGAHRYGYLELA